MKSAAMKALLLASSSLIWFAIGSAPASAAVPLVQLSSDPFTNTTSQHRTQVEPDTFSFGSTIVSAFQVGRFFDGGSSDIGFATSNNGGASWTTAFCPASRPRGGATAGPAIRRSPTTRARRLADLLAGSRGTGGRCARQPLHRRRDSPGATRSRDRHAALDKDWIVCDNPAAEPVLRPLLRRVGRQPERRCGSG